MAEYDYKKIVQEVGLMLCDSEVSKMVNKGTLLDGPCEDGETETGLALIVLGHLFNKFQDIKKTNMKTRNQTIYYKILRETSKYNKYMKWHILCYRSDGSLLSSNYTRTKKEAIKSMSKPCRLLPIGDGYIKTIYKEV